jgi:hypothetical protein
LNSRSPEFQIKQVVGLSDEPAEVTAAAAAAKEHAAPRGRYRSQASAFDCLDAAIAKPATAS